MQYAAHMIQYYAHRNDIERRDEYLDAVHPRQHAMHVHAFYKHKADRLLKRRKSSRGMIRPMSATSRYMGKSRIWLQRSAHMMGVL